MSSITESIDVAVPVRTAYDQWTQFESFPQFMDGVESITQRSDTLTHWKIKIGGVEREFDARITEQHPDERVAWESVDGPRHAGWSPSTASTTTTPGHPADGHRA